MLARAMGFGVEGVTGFPVTVEAYVTGGMPMFSIVGLPDAVMRESRERLNAALENSGFRLPDQRVTVSLQPAEAQKQGAGFELPIAVAVIKASQPIEMPLIDNTLLLGGLSLDGRLSPVRGVLPMVISACEHGVRHVVLPRGNAPEVQCIEGMIVYPADSLREVIGHVTGERPLAPQAQIPYDACLSRTARGYDLKEVRGQHAARRALEIAAAGGHNLLMVGAPGSGKTMLARCLPGILPPMSFEESLETTRIHSISGVMAIGSGLMTERPFRAPHHNASAPSLIGGGSGAMPGEISLAHNGVLFLDELPEFSRAALEAMRQPLEDGEISLARVRARQTYLARCMLVASMNPCPCGYHGSMQKQCRCTSHEIKRYLARISGPLLDRIDLQVGVDAVPVSDMNGAPAGEDSDSVRARVTAARARQLKRLHPAGIYTNAQMTGETLKKACEMDERANQLFMKAARHYSLSMRACSRVLKVARTICDLRGGDTLCAEDVAEAVQYRVLDPRYAAEA